MWTNSGVCGQGLRGVFFKNHLLWFTLATICSGRGGISSSANKPFCGSVTFSLANWLLWARVIGLRELRVWKSGGFSNPALPIYWLIYILVVDTTLSGILMTWASTYIPFWPQLWPKTSKIPTFLASGGWQHVTGSIKILCMSAKHRTPTRYNRWAIKE